MKSMKLLGSAILLLILSTNFALAASTVRTGEMVTIASDQSVEGDFYGFGNSVAISGKVKEDLLLLAGTLTLNGEFGADIAAVGGNIDLHGDVADDVRLVGGTVTIAGEIKGNLVVVAGELNVLSTARIEGDLMFFGGSAEISGYVGKDVLGSSEKIRIDGEVNGGVDVATGQLVLGDRAEVKNNVSYTSATELVRAQDAKVQGKIVRSDAPVVEVNNAKDILIPFLITLFSALVWFLLFKRFVNNLAQASLVSPFRKFAIGFGVMFLMPISALILFISTLGSIIGVTLVFVYFVLIFVALTLMGVVTGSYLSKVIAYGDRSSIFYVALGVLVNHLMIYVPVVGPIVLIAVLTITIGAITERFYSLLRQ